MLKEEIRIKYNSWRSLLSADEVDQKSRAIAEKFIQSELWKGISVLHLFMSIPGKHEVDTSYIRSYFFQYHPEIRLCTSVIDEETNALIHTCIYPDTEYVSSKWNIPQPVHIEKVAVESIDVILIPLLAFDSNGTRVGYGKGYYDRFLATCRPDVIRAGVSLFDMEEEEIKNDPWDVPLTHGISPGIIYYI